MKKTYTEQDIQVLSDFEHVRKRTALYLGSMSETTYEVPVFLNNSFSIEPITFIPALYKCVGEVVDNSLDEYKQFTPPSPHLIINCDPEKGQYSIIDKGRGVPIGIHESGQHTPEVVFGSLRSGRNFSDDRQSGVIGMNGIGSSAVNAVSTEFTVTIKRDNQLYTQTFSNGGIQKTKPSIRKRTSSHSGTQIDFTLDPDVFKNVSLPTTLIENKAIELALTNPNLIVEFNGKKYKYSKGIEDLVKKISTNYFKFSGEGFDFFILFGVVSGVDEKIFSWVNSSLLFDGGLCNTQFLNAFYDKTMQHLESQAKKLKCEVTKNDIRRNLLIFGDLKISNPQYDSQAKTRFVGPNLKKEFVEALDNQWSVFARKNKEWLSDVLKEAENRHHSQANKKAIKEHTKKFQKKIPGLIDCVNTNRLDCGLIISEGLSAASNVTEVRDPKTIASFPLTGKINNVYGSTIAQVLKMSKVTGLLSAIGLVPGKKAMRGDLRYGKIIIATDADYDGADIFTLLVNLFYQFWPELFSETNPFIYRLIAPNVVVTYNKKRIHYPSRSEYEQNKHKYSNKKVSVEYMKGLGSMLKVDWELILSDTRYLIPIVDDGNLATTLELLFGPSADNRKQWLMEKENEMAS